MNEQEQEQAAISLEVAKKKVALGDSMAKLMNNTYFKELFLDGYLESYAARLVRLKGSMGAQDPKQQEMIISQINAIGAFNSYITFIQQEAEMCRKSIEDYEAEDMEAEV